MRVLVMVPNGYSSKPTRMQDLFNFVKQVNVKEHVKLSARWLKASIHSSQKRIHLVPITVRRHLSMYLQVSINQNSKFFWR